MTDEKKIKMYGVWIMDGHSEPIALFEFAEQAEEWGRDNYFGEWLLREVEIPLLSITSGFTDEQLKEIEEEGKRLAAAFNPLPEAED